MQICSERALNTALELIVLELTAVGTKHRSIAFPSEEEDVSASNRKMSSGTQVIWKRRTFHVKPPGGKETVG